MISKAHLYLPLLLVLSACFEGSEESLTAPDGVPVHSVEPVPASPIGCLVYTRESTGVYRRGELPLAFDSVTMSEWDGGLQTYRYRLVHGETGVGLVVANCLIPATTTATHTIARRFQAAGRGEDVALSSPATRATRQYLAAALRLLLPKPLNASTTVQDSTSECPGDGDGYCELDALHVQVEVSPFTYDEIFWDDPFWDGFDYDFTCYDCYYGGGGGGGGGGGEGSNPVTCGDERDTIVSEYGIFALTHIWNPECTEFASSGGSINFSWSELNGGFTNGNPHATWGHIKSVLLNGLEGTRAGYGGPIRLSSGYRCPHGNDAVNGVDNSWHQFGKAADMFSVYSVPWTEEEFASMRGAALDTNPVPIEALNWNSYKDHHLHVAW